MDKGNPPAKSDSQLELIAKHPDHYVSFLNLASGAPAMFLAGSGATHSFVDLSFANHYGFARHPSRQSVLSFNDTSESTSKCYIKVRLQNHISVVECQVLDMQQQFDVILGQDWFLKTGAVLDFFDTCHVCTKTWTQMCH